MLRFSPEQEAAVIANRLTIDAQAAAMRDAMAPGLLGNALSLPRDVWAEWDNEAVTILRTKAIVFNDLAASVSRPIPIGKIIHHFQTVSDSGEVNISLDGRSKARLDKPVYDYHGTPIPIIDSTFGWGWREMAAAESEGFNLEPAGRDNAMDKVAMALEAGVLEGFADIQVNGAASFGLRNAPKRQSRSTTNTLNAATGAEWLADVVATLKLLRDKGDYEPVTLYVNSGDWFYASNTDYSTGYPKTIAQRIREVEGIANVVASPSIKAKELIAVVKTRRNVTLLSAMPMNTQALFRANAQDDYNFVTMAAAALEVRHDANGYTGIAVSAPT